MAASRPARTVSPSSTTFLSHVQRVRSEEKPSLILLRSWLRCWTALAYSMAALA
jgi:hypothetical protein